MEPLRTWVVGFGTVGRWLVSALDVHPEVVVVGLANARDGFVHNGDGVDVRAALAGGRLTDLPGVSSWPTALEGLRATEADVLVEVTASPPKDGEPGLAHIREALERGIPVATSNKWPVALHGLELAELARRRRVSFRAESTVMSGTPLLRALVDGLAGAVPIGLRGLLNATNNFILSRMAEGVSYEDALTEAQDAGLAERDPAADVDGHDVVAKVMILAALVFGRQLRPDDVALRGISSLSEDEVAVVTSPETRLKHVATLDFQSDVHARVEPELLPRTDPLASIDGTTNVVVCRADPVGEVTIAGPGAGPQLAGQGVLSDLLSIARSRELREG